MKTTRSHSTTSFELLESRIAPAAVFTFTDVDGDQVTIKTSRGTNADLAAAAHVVGGQLQLLDLFSPKIGEFDHTDLTITATRGPAGDGQVNVGFIDAGALHLGNVRIDGDLGRLHAGTGTGSVAIQSLTALSLGHFGTKTQAPGGSLLSTIEGSAGSIRITGDVDGASIDLISPHSSLGTLLVGGSMREAGLDVSGKIGSVKVGGDFTNEGAAQGVRLAATESIGSVVIGGSVHGEQFNSGQIAAGAGIATVRIGGSLSGGPGSNSGSIMAGGKIGVVKIGGDEVGGAGAASGSMQAGSFGTVSIGGSLIGGNVGAKTGRISANGALGRVTIGGDVIGQAGDYGASIAGGDLALLKIAGDLHGGSGIASGNVSSGGNIGTVIIGGSIAGGGKLLAGSLTCLKAVHTLSVGSHLSGGAGEQTGYFSAAKLGTGRVGGSLLGGAAQDSGAIEVGTIGTLVVGGDVQGGSAVHSGSITGNSAGSLRVLGSLVGGTANQSGLLRVGLVQSLSIGGSVVGGSTTQAGQALAESGTVHVDSAEKLTIRGSVIGGTEVNLSVLDNCGVLLCDDRLGDVVIGGSLLGNSIERTGLYIGGAAHDGNVLRSLQIAGAVDHADILVGYGTDHVPLKADVKVGAVTAGSWSASSLAVGISANANGAFGDGNDTVIPGGKAGVVSSIASIIIRGACTGTASAGDAYGFVAERIGAFSTGGEKLALSAGKETAALGGFGDVHLVEV